MFLTVSSMVAVVAFQAPGNYALVEMQRIPGDGPDHFLDQVVDLEIGIRQEVFAVLPEQHIVAMFDSAGRFVGSLGREGSGPGEFRFPITGGWIADTLWIWDGALSRFSLWDRMGDFVRSVNVTRRSAVALLRDGTVLLAVEEEPRARRAPPPPSPSAPLHMVRFDPVTEQQDTIARTSFQQASLFVGVGQGGVYMKQPFVTNPLLKVSSTGDAVFLIQETRASGSGGPSIEIVRIDLTGDTIFVRHHPFVPMPMSGNVVDSTVEAIVDRLTRTAPPRFGRPVISESAIRDNLIIPDHMPPVTDVAVEREGGIWLRSQESVNGRSVWHTFGPTGVYRGRVSVPMSLKILRVHGDLIWGTEHDDLDVPSIVQYRLTKQR